LRNKLRKRSSSWKMMIIDQCKIISRRLSRYKVKWKMINSRSQIIISCLLMMISRNNKSAAKMIKMKINNNNLMVGIGKLRIVCSNIMLICFRVVRKMKKRRRMSKNRIR